MNELKLFILKNCANTGLNYWKNQVLYCYVYSVQDPTCSKHFKNILHK